MTFKLKLNRQVKLTLIIVFSLLLLYFLIRTGFLIYNYNRFSQFSASEIFSAFLIGLRFDISSIFFINIFPLVLLNLPGKIFRNKYYEGTIFTILVAANLLMIIISFSDYGYYNITERRLSYELYFMISDIISILPGLIISHYIISIIILLTAAAIIYFSSKFIKSFHIKHPRKSTFVKELLFLIVLIICSVIAIRGGLQLKPLRQANAFPNENLELGYLALNTSYTVIRSYFQNNIKVIENLDYDDALTTVRKMISTDKDKFIDDGFPFLRITEADSGINKMNVVIFIMESWSANLCGSITGKNSFTPFFDSLAEHSILFTSFFANGQRSIESVPSITASIPSLFDISIIGSRAELNNIKGLGSILKREGYTTSFHHGAKRGSMGFDGFTKLAGFDNYFGKEDMSEYDDDDTDGMWGICDEPFFIESAKNIDKFNQPFCSVIFSLSSHDPFRIPDKRKSLFEKYSGEKELERSIRYSDFSLQKFFEYVKTKSWFDNTVFLITADHTLYNTRKDFESTFHIPLLIFNPKNSTGTKYDKPASQIDIVPSLIDMLNITTKHSSMGKSIFDTEERFVVFKFHSEYTILTDQYRLGNTLEKAPTLYFNNDSSNIDLSEDKPEIVSELNKKLLAYLQLVSYSVAHNKIFIPDR